MSSPAQNLKKIQLLPEHIIDQIKAGEVIERPSTLLKELLENSVDAGADEIEIEIINNGLDLLSVKDNGKGIPFEDLDLAFCRHATSKIERFEDIYNLYTYGFRGEALASIAAVSKLTCVSNPKDSPEGTIKINGGETVALDRDKVSEEKSKTCMYIRDLFYNTPARMKFIQSKTSEKNQLDKIVKAFLLTQPEIKFSLKWDGLDKQVFPARAEDKLKQRVEDAIKKSRHLNLFETGREYDGAGFKIFLSRESSRGNAGKSQFIFVNGRLVQDIQLHKVIINSAQRMWPQGESGHYCAYIEVEPERVDVNIHPNKTQVKFYEAGKIFSLVSGAIKDGILKSAVSAQAQFPPREEFNMELKGVEKQKEMAQVDYRRYDFDSKTSSSLESYFQRLDGSLPHEENKNHGDDSGTAFLLSHFDDLALFKIQNKVYGVKTPQMMSLWFRETLKNGDKTPVPLLVSQPLELDIPLDESFLAKLSEVGFEMDRLGPKDYALRTFPSCLKHFPYQEYLQGYLAARPSENDPLEALAHHIEKDQSRWIRHHKKALESLGIALLLKEKAAVEITRETLGKIL